MTVFNYKHFHQNESPFRIPGREAIFPYLAKLDQSTFGQEIRRLRTNPFPEQSVSAAVSLCAHIREGWARSGILTSVAKIFTEKGCQKSRCMSVSGIQTPPNLTQSHMFT